MPHPGVFKDLGKQAKDLLGKEYDVGQQKLEVKSSASNGVSFTSETVKDKDGIKSHLECKKKLGSGVSITGKVKNDSVLVGALELDSTVMKNLKLVWDLETCPKAESVLKVNKPSCEFKHDVFTMLGAYDVQKSELAMDLVVGQNGLSLGGQCAYNLQKSAMGKYTTSLMYKTSDFAVTGTYAKGGDMKGSYYHKVSGDMQIAGEVAFAAKDKSTKATIGGLHKLDKDTTLKGKLDSKGMLALSCGQAISPKLKLTLAATVNTSKLDKPEQHKLGMSLNLSA